MNRLRKLHIRALAITIMAMLAATAQAAVSFTVQAPRQVVEGNKFNVTFVLENAEGSGFGAPEVGGAGKIYGPALSTSYSSSWVNGKTSKSSSQEYTMIYKASRAGKCTVGSASITVGGQRMTTKPFTVEVLPPDQAEARERQRRSQVQYDDPSTQSADKAVSANDLFVRIEMSKPRVYEQQAVVCTIKLYTKYQVSQFIPTLQPSFDGFLIEEIPMQPSLNNVEHVNGQNYMVAVLKKCLLYPQQSGKLTITSGNYDVNVVQYEQFRTPFGTMQQPVERKLQVKSNQATINILPLPEPRPSSFTGAVGKFNVTTTLKPASLKTYQAATFSYVISGSGNIKYIKAPSVTFPSQFDVYDPKNNVSVNAGGGDMSGTVTIDYTFIPQYAGDFDIPAGEFTYFDPDAGRYETIPVAGRHLTVAKGEGTPSNHYRLKNMDIRHIKTGDLHQQRAQHYMVDGWSYWLWYLLPLLAMAGLMAYYRKQIKERANVSLMRTKRASKVATKRLKNARALAARGDRTAFYAELLTAAWGYLSDKLTIPVSELSKDNIATELEAYGVDQSLRERTLHLLDDAEFAQYAPELASQPMDQVLDEAAAVIDSLEKVKKAKQPTS